MPEKRKPLQSDGLAAEDCKGFDSAEFLPGRIERYGKARAHALQTLAHVDQQLNGLDYFSRSRLDSIASRLRQCGSYLVFAHYYTVDTVRLTHATFCMTHLLCPLCAIRRGAKQVRAYLQRLEVILKDNPHLVPYLVTLTVANGPDLRERFNHLHASMRRYTDRMRDAAKKGVGYCELNKIRGAVWSYEVTSKGNGWHPHLHMVALVDPSNPIDFDPKRPKASKLSKEWSGITGDSFIVDCRPISGDPADGFVEVFKYALKFSELSPSDNLHAWEVLSGRRLVSSFGLFRGVDVPDDLTDAALEDLPFVRLFYRYTPSGYSLEGFAEADAPAA